MAWKLLQPSINLGLEESKFWDMTIAEVSRYLEGATWRLKAKAQFDYALADLIGISTARIMSTEVTMPAIEDVYPNLFEKVVEEKPKDDLTTKSVNNFLARAMQINAARKKDGGEHNK